MKKKRLLRITTVGSQQNLLLYGQHSYFISNGFEVIAMCADDFHVKELLDREKCNWIHIPFVRSFSPFRDILALLVLLFHINRLKPDIVHTHSPKAGLLGQIAAFLCRVPCRIHTVAGLPVIEYVGIKKFVLMYFEKFTYLLSHWVLPNSYKLYKYLLTHDLTSSDKLKVIGNGSTNGINIDYYSPSLDVAESSVSLKAELKISDGSLILVYVGRLTPSKGTVELVKAFELLSVVHKDLYLVLVGNFDEKDLLPSELKEVILNREKIIYMGHQKDVRPFLHMSDIFVFPSYREGLPQSLLQACAMSKCCVASDIDGCNEIIDSNSRGLLISVKSIEALVNSINLLIRDQDLRNSFGTAARSFVVDRYEQKYLYEELKLFYLKHIK